VCRVRSSEDKGADEIGRHLLSLPEVNQYIIFRLKLCGGMTPWAPITELAPPFFRTAPIKTVLVCPLTNTVASTGATAVSDPTSSPGRYQHCALVQDPPVTPLTPCSV
jgi:hypothetical protein